MSITDDGVGVRSARPGPSGDISHTFAAASIGASRFIGHGSFTA
jgi:hypothetical protein